MNSLRIAMGVRHFRPMGGAEKFSMRLAEYLVRQGHRVTVFAFDGAPAAGVKLLLLPKPRALRAWRDWATGKILAGALSRCDADVTWGEQKTWGAHIIRPNGGSEEEYWKNRAQFSRAPWTGKFSLKRKCDLKAEAAGYHDSRLRRVVVNSHLVERHLLAHYPTLAGRITVVHNGIDPIGIDRAADGERAARLSAIGLRPAARTLLFAGHEFARKGLGPALHSLAAAAASADVQLIVAGRDRAKPFRQLATALKIADRVAFVGGEQSTREWLAVADALLFPSYFDSFGFVIVEALGAGVPVITARTAGGSEVVRHMHSGWVVKHPDDIRDLSDGILAITDPTAWPARRTAALADAALLKMDGQLGLVEQAILQTARGG